MTSTEAFIQAVEQNKNTNLTITAGVVNDVCQRLPAEPIAQGLGKLFLRVRPEAKVMIAHGQAAHLVGKLRELDAPAEVQPEPIPQASTEATNDAASA